MAVEGINATVSLAARRARKLLASYPLSANSRVGGGTLPSSAGAVEISASFPGPGRKATARPQPSVRALILVVGPPRERPMAQIFAMCRAVGAHGGAVHAQIIGQARLRRQDGKDTVSANPQRLFFDFIEDAPQKFRFPGY